MKVAAWASRIGLPADRVTIRSAVWTAENADLDQVLRRRDEYLAGAAHVDASRSR
jgi:hypothetical protein